MFWVVVIIVILFLLLGRYRFAKLCPALGILFLIASILWAIYYIFQGYTLWYGLKIVFWGVIIKFLFDIFYALLIRSYVKSLIRRFGDLPSNYKIMLFKTEELNAIAYNDNDQKAIAITTRAVKEANKDEFNFIIAHEFAHHQLSHMTVKVWTEALSIGSYMGLAFLAGLGIFSLPSALVGGALMKLVKQSYYRKEEYEADEVGIAYLKLAGLSQKGAITFLAKIAVLYGEENLGLLDKAFNWFFGTHPFCRDRLERVKRLVQF